MIITKARASLVALAAAATLAIGAVPLASTASARPRGGGPSVGARNTNVSFCADMLIVVQADAAAFDQAKAAGDSAGMAAAYTWEENDYKSAHNAGCAWAP